MSKDNKNTKRNKIIALSLLVIVVGGGGFLLGWLFDRNWYFNILPKEITPELDGIINEREWMKSSYHNIPFYLDVNNSIDPIVNKANVDGWNFLSIAEDEENYYFALDLCSDQTNNLDGEWISFGLGNRLADTTDSELAFYAMENYGFEYLVYNVSADRVFDYQINYLPEQQTFYDIPFVPEYNSYELVRGETEGDILNMWAYDQHDGIFDDELVLTLKSNYYDNTSLYEAGDYAIMDFGVNVSEIFPTYNSTDFPVSTFAMELVLAANVGASTSFAEYNSSADTIWFTILEHGPMPAEFEDPQYMSVFNNKSFSNEEYFHWISPINFDQTQINATNGMFYFSILGWNPLNLTDPTSFELNINKMSFRIRTSWIRTTLGTTIQAENFDVVYAFDSSPMCAEEHRMFEIRVSKSEFPNTPDDKLYLNLAGYGTMAMEGTDYWVYPPDLSSGYLNTVMDYYYNSYFDFLSFDMSIT